MFRFSIRELMLFILVVGLSLGWGRDHFKLSESCDKLTRQSAGRADYLNRLNVKITPAEGTDFGEFYGMSGSDIMALPDCPLKRRFESIRKMSAAAFANADDQVDTSSSPSLRP